MDLTHDSDFTTTTSTTTTTTERITTTTIRTSTSTMSKQVKEFSTYIVLLGYLFNNQSISDEYISLYSFSKVFDNFEECSRKLR